MSRKLDIDLLRQFVVLAEDLHFSRAAVRLFISQQTLSRSIRRLERDAGTELIERTTRRVNLTPQGMSLLTRARELIALNDAILDGLQNVAPSLTVDIMGPGLTPASVVREEMKFHPDDAVFIRTIAGAITATDQLMSGEIDVTFGRIIELNADTAHELIRYEPIVLLIPDDHPLAALESVPLEALRDSRVCFRSGDHASSTWEHAVRQLLEPFNLDSSPAHPHVHGAAEMSKHLRERHAPILTIASQPHVTGAVKRPIIDPIPLYPLSMMWRNGYNSAELDHLRAVARQTASRRHWLTIPSNSWLPSPESEIRSNRKS